MQVPEVQEKWAHSQRETAPSLLRLWTPVRPMLRAIPYFGGQAWSHRTLARGADFVTGHLSCGGRHPQVALGVSGPMLRGLAESSACPTRLLYPRCVDTTTGGGSR